MGIDIHSRNFIAYAARRQTLGCVATIGKQNLMVPQDITQFGNFCESWLMQRLGATLVDSYDNSDYEGATHVADLNEPLAPKRRYNTVIDCGCSEHIFNVPQALRNISLLCENGGQVIHVLPANNFCGHGFWQFSPELFFSLYSAANGYHETEVFLADLANRHAWFEVTCPRDGRRAEIRSRTEVYALCRTVKRSEIFPGNIQQSDYMHAWGAKPDSRSHPTQTSGMARRIMTRIPALQRFGRFVYLKARESVNAVTNSKRLSSRNRHLKRRSISTLLRDQGRP